jgi:hypothetical protein
MRIIIMGSNNWFDADTATRYESTDPTETLYCTTKRNWVVVEQGIARAMSPLEAARWLMEVGLDIPEALTDSLRHSEV